MSTEEWPEISGDAADRELTELMFLVPLVEVWVRVNEALGSPDSDDWTREDEAERIIKIVDALGEGHFWAYRLRRRLRRLPISLLRSLTWSDLSGFTLASWLDLSHDGFANSVFVARSDDAAPYERFTDSFIYIERATANRALMALLPDAVGGPPAPNARPKDKSGMEREAQNYVRWHLERGIIPLRDERQRWIMDNLGVTRQRARELLHNVAPAEWSRPGCRSSND